MKRSRICEKCWNSFRARGCRGCTYKLPMKTREIFLALSMRRLKLSVAFGGKPEDASAKRQQTSHGVHKVWGKRLLAQSVAVSKIGLGKKSG